MRFSIDTNVLLYAFEEDTDRGETAARTIARALLRDCVLTNQVLGEFNNVVRGRMPDRMRAAREVVSAWSFVFPVVPTSTAQLIVASELSEQHRLQYWDSLILVVAGAAGAECLITEDMNDGATIDGVRLLNPFKPDNAELLEALLAV